MMEFPFIFKSIKIVILFFLFLAFQYSIFEFLIVVFTFNQVPKNKKEIGYEITKSLMPITILYIVKLLLFQCPDKKHVSTLILFYSIKFIFIFIIYIRREYIKKLSWKNFLLVLLTLTVLFYSLDNPLEPQLWSPSFKLPNNMVTEYGKSLEYTKHVGSNILLAPESLAIDKEKGNIYASLADGRVVMLTDEGKYMKTIFFRGEYIFNDSNLNKLSLDCTAKAVTHELA